MEKKVVLGEEVVNNAMMIKGKGVEIIEEKLHLVERIKVVTVPKFSEFGRGGFFNNEAKKAATCLTIVLNLDTWLVTSFIILVPSSTKSSISMRSSRFIWRSNSRDIMECGGEGGED